MPVYKVFLLCTSVLLGSEETTQLRLAIHATAAATLLVLGGDAATVHDHGRQQVASHRNDHYVDQLVASGSVFTASATHGSLAAAVIVVEAAVLLGVIVLGILMGPKNS